MAFNAGTLVATIQLGGKDKFDSDLASSGRAFQSTSSLMDRAGKAIASGFRGAAIATGVATAASAAYVTSLFRTGVAYNTLQQQSRAALKTILGGTQQANAQMDKLDAFAKQSPFAKSVFITAQQQLLGFGLQAKKVIPTLQAVEDAVAAVGGSNDQISQITYALAQVKGQGKLTGETLNQLGQFGIDAASIIGKEMGKTGAEIRDMASSPGGIPADQVWDLLINGLEKKFAGASANVKATWSGTTDRIKAASRDIGATLAAPFIDPHGGGQAIVWGNQVADIMRAVQAKVTPVLTLLTGRAQPVFANITGWLERAKDAVNDWDPKSLITTFDKAAHYAPAIGGLGGAVIGMNLGLLKSIPILGKFVPAVNPVVATLGGIVLASPEARDALVELLDAFKPLIPVVGDLAKILAGDLTAIMPSVASGIEGVAHVAGPLVDLLGKIPTPLLLAVGGFIAFQKVQQPFANGLLNAGIRVEGFLGKLGGIGGKLGGIVTAFGDAAAFLSGPWGLAVGGAAALLVGTFLDNMAAAKQKVDDYTDSLDTNTGAITDNTRASAFNNLQKAGALDAGAKVGLDSKTLVDASLGDAKARATVQAAQKAAADQYGKTAKPGEAGGELLAAANTAANAVGVESNSLKESMRIKQQWLQATDGEKKSLDDVAAAHKTYADSVKENGKSTDQSTAAYKSNKAALDDLGKKSIDYVTTVKNQEQSAQATMRAQNNMAASLVTSAEQMGMSKQAAIDYTAKLLGIPASRVTEVATSGTGAAAKNAKSVKDAVNAVPSNHNTNVTVNAYGAFATLDELNAYLNQLGNKEISIGGGAAGYYGFGPHKAAGGDIVGPGSGTSDDVPIWASNGEFVVRAAMARKYHDALEAINANRYPIRRYATGGVVIGTDRPTSMQAHFPANAAQIGAVQGGPSRVQNVNFITNYPVGRDPVESIREAGQAVSAMLSLG